MRHIKYSLMGLALAAAGLTSCQDSYDAPELVDPVATMKPNTSLLEIKEMILDQYDGENDVVIPVGTKENGDHYIIHGRVISSDASGNIYQNLVLQDETSALTLSIREASMWTSYRVGQDVVLDITGLYMGTYSGLYQIGWLSDYYGADSMTFMSWFMFLEHSEKNGLPNQNFSYLPINSEWPSANPYTLITTIEELSAISSSTIQGIEVMSQLVEIQNVSFVDGGKDTYAEYQESNERRYVQDALGNRIALNNSGYATFHNDILPEGIGTVRGILGYYQDEWQLTIRDLGDVMFEKKGQQEEPYTVAEAIQQDNNGRTGWTRGYIVGSIKAGVNTVTSSSDIVFGSDAQTFDNVVIADSPSETDWTKCMLVSLPAASNFRKYVNLADNPSMLGKILNVRGSFSAYMGMHGIVGNGGGFSDFEVEGAQFGGDTGLGTQNSPYKIAYLVESEVPENDVWIEGYIVGFVNGPAFSADAIFSNDAASMTNYSGNNVILSDSPTGATTANSVPVAVSGNFRLQFGLNYAPGVYGTKVKVQGNTGIYLGSFGLTNSTNWIAQ